MNLLAIQVDLRALLGKLALLVILFSTQVSLLAMLVEILVIPLVLLVILLG